MTYAEFLETLDQAQDRLELAVRNPSAEEFRVIKTVCTNQFRGESNGKAWEQAVEMYTVFGMSVFWDMLPRVEAILKAADSVAGARATLRKSEDYLSWLRATNGRVLRRELDGAERAPISVAGFLAGAQNYIHVQDTETPRTIFVRFSDGMYGEYLIQRVSEHVITPEGASVVRLSEEDDGK